MSVLCKAKKPRKYCTLPTSSNLMLMLRRETPDGHMIPQHLVSSTHLSRNQRCFSQSDRINQTRTSTDMLSKTVNKQSPGYVAPLTTGRVARKCLTKPPDLELLEHAKALESCVSLMKSQRVFIGTDHPVKGLLYLGETQ